MKGDFLTARWNNILLIVRSTSVFNIPPINYAGYSPRLRDLSHFCF